MLLQEVNLDNALPAQDVRIAYYALEPDAFNNKVTRFPVFTFMALLEVTAEVASVIGRKFAFGTAVDAELELFSCHNR